MTSLSELYPEASYVDWTCIDGYNFGTARGNPHGWMTFNQIFSSTYSQIVNTIAPGKPMIIGKIASSEHGGSKATWIREMLAAIPRSFPMIRALVWFDVAEAHDDWPLRPSPSATAAFQQGIANPVYATNTYANLATSPIEPP